MYQAEAYLAGLDRTFDLLAHFPKIGRSVQELALAIVASAFRRISSSMQKRRILWSFAPFSIIPAR
jgi:plasmid stabilization system protein ParE